MHCDFDYLMKKQCVCAPLWQHGLLYIFKWQRESLLVMLSREDSGFAL